MDLPIPEEILKGEPHDFFLLHQLKRQERSQTENEEITSDTEPEITIAPPVIFVDASDSICYPRRASRRASFDPYKKPQPYKMPAGLVPEGEDFQCWEIVNGELRSRKRNSCSRYCILHKRRYLGMTQKAIDEEVDRLLKPIFARRRTDGAGASSSSQNNNIDPDQPPTVADLENMLDNLAVKPNEPEDTESMDESDDDNY